MNLIFQLQNEQTLSIFRSRSKKKIFFFEESEVCMVRDGDTKGNRHVYIIILLKRIYTKVYISYYFIKEFV